MSISLVRLLLFHLSSICIRIISFIFSFIPSLFHFNTVLVFKDGTYRTLVALQVAFTLEKFNCFLTDTTDF